MKKKSFFSSQGENNEEEIIKKKEMPTVLNYDEKFKKFQVFLSFALLKINEYKLQFLPHIHCNCKSKRKKMAYQMQENLEF